MKYRLDFNDKIEYDGHTLYRVVELVGNHAASRQDLRGGYIESEENLSQTGDCWVYLHAKVYGNSKIMGDAHIANEAVVCNSEVKGNSWVGGDSIVKDSIIEDSIVDSSNINGETIFRERIVNEKLRSEQCISKTVEKIMGYSGKEKLLFIQKLMERGFFDEI